MRITKRLCKSLLDARRQALRKANPKLRDAARHKVKVLEVVQVLRRKGQA